MVIGQGEGYICGNSWSSCNLKDVFGVGFEHTLPCSCRHWVCWFCRLFYFGVDSIWINFIILYRNWLKFWNLVFRFAHNWVWRWFFTSSWTTSSWIAASSVKLMRWLLYYSNGIAPNYSSDSTVVSRESISNHRCRLGLKPKSFSKEVTSFEIINFRAIGLKHR